MRDTYFTTKRKGGESGSFSIHKNGLGTIAYVNFPPMHDKLVRVGLRTFSNWGKDGLVHLVSEDGEVYVQADGENIYTSEGGYPYEDTDETSVYFYDKSDLHLLTANPDHSEVQVTVLDKAINDEEAIKIVVALLLIDMRK